jgi:hypothetical protein
MCRLADGGRAGSFEHPPSKRIMRKSRILFEVIVLVAPWKEASPRMGRRRRIEHAFGSSKCPTTIA